MFCRHQIRIKDTGNKRCAEGRCADGKRARTAYFPWVSTEYTDADGKVEQYKARLFTCSNEQLFGFYYTLTFAAVMELGTVKIIFSSLAQIKCASTTQRCGKCIRKGRSRKEPRHLHEDTMWDASCSRDVGLALSCRQKTAGVVAQEIPVRIEASRKIVEQASTI